MNTWPVNQTKGRWLYGRGRANLKSRSKTPSGVKSIVHCFTFWNNHWKICLLSVHWVKIWKLFSSIWHVGQFAVSIFGIWSARSLSLVGKIWWRSLHKNMMHSLSRPLSLAIVHVLSQLWSGKKSISERQGIKHLVKLPFTGSSNSSVIISVIRNWVQSLHWGDIFSAFDSWWYRLVKVVSVVWWFWRLWYLVILLYVPHIKCLMIWRP